MASRRRTTGQGTTRPTSVSPGLGARDPRARIARQMAGIDEDPEAFERDRRGRQTVRLAPRGGLGRGAEGHRVEIGRYVAIGRDGKVTLDLGALLGPALMVDEKGRVTLRLGNLQARADGALETVPAGFVVDLTDSTGGTPGATLAAVSGTGDDATINDNLASIAAQVGEIKAALAAAGYGIGVLP